MAGDSVSNTRVCLVMGIVGLFGIITFALAAATLGTLNKRMDKLDDKLAAAANTTTPGTSLNLESRVAELVHITDLMNHLKGLETIAKESGDTRAVGTVGFVKTVDYIDNYLRQNAPNLNIFRQNFSVQNFSVQGNPRLIWSDNNINRTLTYSNDLAKSDFTYVNYSGGIGLTRFDVGLVANNGCDPSDWTGINNRAALVISGGICTNAEKGELAVRAGARALLFYNNGYTTSSLAPAIIRLRQANRLPALFLSYGSGRALIDAINNRPNAVSVFLEILLNLYGTFTVQNICADTPTGNSNETIVVGSHSDSVPAGPGINDNGSGSAANLVLATILARLYADNQYEKYRYRVRFCWWGAEEIGLVGAISHAEQAQSPSATVGNRIRDYIVNLNYDMLGSPNYIFGVYDGRTTKPGTPSQVIKGSIRISEEFMNWFKRQRLPSDYTDFSGRSDYGPFLAAGIVAGGLFSGADETKTVSQRDQYDQLLGKGRGGLAGAIQDPCYHRACDTVENIDQFGYLKMVQAAAYMLEYLGKKNDLVNWLYPDGRPVQVRLPDDYFPNSDYYREL